MYEHYIRICTVSGSLHTIHRVTKSMLHYFAKVRIVSGSADVFFHNKFKFVFIPANYMLSEFENNEFQVDFYEF